MLPSHPIRRPTPTIVSLPTLLLVIGAFLHCQNAFSLSERWVCVNIPSPGTTAGGSSIRWQRLAAVTHAALPSGAFLVLSFSCACCRGQLPFFCLLPSSHHPGRLGSLRLVCSLFFRRSHGLQCSQWRPLRASSRGFPRPCDMISLISRLRGAFWHNRPPRLTCASSAPALKSAKAGRLFRNQDLGHRSCQFGA